MIPLFFDVTKLDSLARSEFLLSEELMMEHAALALKSQIERLLSENSKVLIVTGPGNNGADGFALARLLDKYKVSIYEAIEPKSQMCILQKNRCIKAGVHFAAVLDTEYDLVVDAIFGSGLSKPISQELQNLITKLNNINGHKIACDIPTGLNLDGYGETIFKANMTVTMGAEKLALYSDNAKKHVGKIAICNLGISYNNYIQQGVVAAHRLEDSDLNLPQRDDPSVHKGNFGHLAVIAGDKEGAAILCGMSALVFGAGLVTLVAENKLALLQPDLMQGSNIPKNTTAISIGCGLGSSLDLHKLNEISAINCKMILDADILTKESILEFLGGDAVITPHPKEFSRLLEICGLGIYDIPTVQCKRFELARLFSANYPNITLVLKGANTIIIKNSRMFISDIGTASLAKGGSGDVLSGMIGAMLAQGYDPLNSAITSVLAHSKASKEFKNSYSLTPTDLIEKIKNL